MGKMARGMLKTIFERFFKSITSFSIFGPLNPCQLFFHIKQHAQVVFWSFFNSSLNTGNKVLIIEAIATRFLHLCCH